MGTEFFYILSFILGAAAEQSSLGTVAGIDFGTEGSPDRAYLGYLRLYVCLPACVLKNVVNLVQLKDAMAAIAGTDARLRNEKSEEDEAEEEEEQEQEEDGGGTRAA